MYIHIYACRGHYNLGQCVFAYNSHTVCHTLKNLVSTDSLNGADSLCHWPRPLPPREFFCKIAKNWKTYFFKLLLENLSDLRETWHIHSSAGPHLKLSKEFCTGKGCSEFGKFWALRGAKSMGSSYLLNSDTDFEEIWAV